MPYPINQRAYQFNSIQSVPVSFGLWDTALKFLSPGPRNDVTNHLGMGEQTFTGLTSIFNLKRRIHLLKQVRIIPFFPLNQRYFFLSGIVSPFSHNNPVALIHLAKDCDNFIITFKRTKLLFKSRKKDIFSCLKQHHSCCVKK